MDEKPPKNFGSRIVYFFQETLSISEENFLLNIRFSTKMRAIADRPYSPIGHSSFLRKERVTRLVCIFCFAKSAEFFSMHPSFCRERVTRLVCIFCFAKNYGSAASSRSGQQSTGLFDLDYSSLPPA